MKKLLVVLAVLVGFLVSGCVRNGGEKLMIYVSDYGNSRIVILNSDLDWIDSIDQSEEGSTEHLTADKDYIYAEAGLNIYKYMRSSPYTFVDTKSVPVFHDIDSDDDYVYIGIHDDSDYKIQIYKKSDLSFVDEFVTGLFSHIDGIAVDDTYIYCFDGGILKKFKKSDHSQVASVDVGDDGIYTWKDMDGDSTYLCFNAGEVGNGESVAIYAKSDLSKYKVISDISTYSWAIAISGDYAFVVDYSDHVVRKVQISTGNVVATFGEVGVSGSDQSHLENPRGIAYYPSPPGPPTDLLCNDLTNPVDIIPQYFSAIYHGELPGTHARIQVNMKEDFTGRMMFDSGKIPI